ncbi:unnamed protein product [Adineta ricciae]|uniref:Major facilitator superfamily (MFS) profile domain-containing protein n=1 Tax=Adineta ricciae TaxID=249248 RepID=A0A814NYU8_ADIRI|nr:unnamed protein product [Adineta ricciae]CAF1290122.1 unnamed protein product [Adineta ricciae]
MTTWDMHKNIPKRYILGFLAFLGFFNAFMLRSNLSIAIVSMVTPTFHITPSNITIIQPTGYSWSTKTQGYILSSFFYSYAAIQIPAGFLATVLGGRLLFGTSIGLCALLTLLTPLCAHIGPTALIILRILEGFASGFIYPSLHFIWSKWAPKDDKSKLATIAFSGSYFGTFVTIFLGGFIAVHWSWQWIFYLSGLSGLLWTLCWFYFSAESPSTHLTISEEEAAYIEANLVHPVSRNYSIPWKDILTSLPVWAIIAANFGTNWCIYVMLTELPIFLSRALGYQVDQAGVLAGIPWLPLAVLVSAAGIISDRLTQQHSTGYVRKLIMSISFIFISLALLMVTLLDAHHRALIIIGVIIATSSCGPAWASFGVNHLDIGAYYAGILMGVSNCLGSIPGFLVPILTGYIVENTHIKREWNIIFIISIVICVFVLMFYTSFASGELQPWARVHSDEYQHVLSTPIASRDPSQAAGLNDNNIDDLTDRLKAEIQTEQPAE